MSGSNYSELVKTFEQYLAENTFSGQPENLYNPMNYMMGLGGKRVRPVLTLLGCEIFGGSVDKALPSALCVEIFHNFSLVHDDIMDKAPLRRGQQTVHQKWNEAAAILSGDLMLVKAYEALLKSEMSLWPRLLETFNNTAIEVCQGQQWDMDFESMEYIVMSDYIEMIGLKTAALLGASLSMGAICGGATDDEAYKIRRFGELTGLSFQIMDDYLDAFGSSFEIGKQQGGDILANKKTFLLIKALEVGDERSKKELIDLHVDSQMDPKYKVEAVISIFTELEIPAMALEQAAKYNDLAMKEIMGLGLEDKQLAPLVGFMNFLKGRNH
jgi:geranylgeranyl diphosphate synthase type II